jgi:hypothetical protein
MSCWKRSLDGGILLGIAEPFVQAAKALGILQSAVTRLGRVDMLAAHRRAQHMRDGFVRLVAVLFETDKTEHQPVPFSVADERDIDATRANLPTRPALASWSLVNIAVNCRPALGCVVENSMLSRIRAMANALSAKPGHFAGELSEANSAMTEVSTRPVAQG